MNDGPDNLDEVQSRLKEIQRRKRAGIRWSISQHTAEMAIGAIAKPKVERRPCSGKARRRKRKKRLL